MVKPVFIGYLSYSVPFRDKKSSSNEIHKLGFEDFAWHRSFHDHIIRDEKSYVNIFNYISDNPKKWNEDRFNV